MKKRKEKIPLQYKFTFTDCLFCHPRIPNLKDNVQATKIGIGIE